MIPSASLRARWVAFMKARGFRGNVLAEDAVKAAMVFAAAEVERDRCETAKRIDRARRDLGGLEAAHEIGKIVDDLSGWQKRAVAPGGAAIFESIPLVESATATGDKVVVRMWRDGLPNIVWCHDAVHAAALAAFLALGTYAPKK